MPTDLPQWTQLLTQGGLLGGAILVLFGYFRGIWVSGAQAQREKEALQAQITQIRADLAAARSDYETRLTQICADRDALLKTIRDERDAALARSAAREERWAAALLEATRTGRGAITLAAQAIPPPEGTKAP